MNDLQKILVDFELHSAEGIRAGFKKGVDPNTTVNGEPLIYSLINMYTRGPQFKDCIRAFVENGVVFEDKPLLAVLLDDAEGLEQQLKADPEAVTRYRSLAGTFTPLRDVTLLHICAEYNHVACAKVLVRQGAAVNAMAGLDEYGFGGHTPVFHTVNQHDNRSWDMLQFLLLHGADLAITVPGLIWGRGYAWETFIPAVNPVSYAMMGLLRQFQRTEEQIYKVVKVLLKARYGIDYDPPNIPNSYLAG